MQVSMVEWRGGGGGGGSGIGVAFEFFAFSWSHSRPLGLENSSNLIKYPFVVLTKPQFGTKLGVQILRIEGTNEVFKCPPPPLLRLNIDTCR